MDHDDYYLLFGEIWEVADCLLRTYLGWHRNRKTTKKEKEKKDRGHSFRVF